MALSPLDLQTLFTQMDKVGKQEAAQREGAALLQSIQQAKHQQQTDERIKSVNEAQDMGEGTEEINDKNSGRSGRGDRQDKGIEEAGENGINEKDTIIRDPNLGKNIDLSF
ncbi:MAG: hypothetical protein LBH07_08055 [Treponema sp.]|jgi:hypothetical protein|nr:hypothetical protein [Treponema sp.]